MVVLQHCLYFKMMHIDCIFFHFLLYQRCVARLKNSRARLLDRYRHVGDDPGCNLREPFLVQEVMEEEWMALKALDTHLPSLWKKGSLAEVC